MKFHPYKIIIASISILALFLSQAAKTLATVETENSQDKIYYTHTDHLTGSNVMTDKNGSLAQTLDYYPFGAIRLDERAGTFNQQKKFTGKELDKETGLYYGSERQRRGGRLRPIIIKVIIKPCHFKLLVYNRDKSNITFN